MSDFNSIFNESIETGILRIKMKRYNNIDTIRKIEYLNKLGISLNCISSYLEITSSQVYHYKSSKNKVNEKAKKKIDDLIKYATARLKQVIESRLDLSEQHKKELELLRTEGQNIVLFPVVPKHSNKPFLHRGG
jgi:hypothetical protein